MWYSGGLEITIYYKIEIVPGTISLGNLDHDW